MLATFFGLSQSLPEIGLSLTPNHTSKVELVQIPDTHCTYDIFWMDHRGKHITTMTYLTETQ